MLANCPFFKAHWLKLLKKYPDAQLFCIVGGIIYYLSEDGSITPNNGCTYKLTDSKDFLRWLRELHGYRFTLGLSTQGRVVTLEDICTPNHPEMMKQVFRDLLHVRVKKDTFGIQYRGDCQGSTDT